MLPPTTAEVLTKRHAANQNEIQAGRLAEKDGQSKEVKDYGKMLVKDHTAVDKKVAALAKQESIELPAPSTEGEMHNLDAMAGPNFDKKFAGDMVEDHKKDIAELTHARDSTNDPKLKKLLSDVLPTLQKHEDKAQKIVDSQGAK